MRLELASVSLQQTSEAELAGLFFLFFFVVLLEPLSASHSLQVL